MSSLVDGISTHVVASSSTFQAVSNCCLCSAAHYRGFLYTVFSVLETCGLDFLFSSFSSVNKLYKPIQTENTIAICAWGEILHISARKVNIKKGKNI